MILKRILCFFAHPDDETFGPGGSLALWASRGAHIKIISVTSGDAGQNATSSPTGQVRVQELRSAAKILGVRQVTIWNYPDGRLTNADLPALSRKFARQIKSFRPDTIITYNFNGVSGHLDHIAVSSAATKAFLDTHIARRLFYYSTSRHNSNQMGGYFIYFPPGLTPDQADLVVDTSSVWDIKVQAMRQHQSQIADVRHILSMAKHQPHQDLFLVCTL